MAGSLFVIGSGQIARAVAARFVQTGWNVRVGHRSGGPFPDNLRDRGVREVFLDRAVEGELTKAIGAGADAVIDTIAYTPTHAAQLRKIEEGVGAFAVISSMSVYRDDGGRTLDEAREVGFPRFEGPIAEAQPTTDPGPETYSTRKVALERALYDLRSPVVILRPGAIHGPGCNAPREWWYVKRALDGRTRVPVAYGGSSRFHTTAAANIAELCHVALERRATGVFNIGDPDPPSVSEVGAMIARAVAHAWDVVGMPKHPEGVVGQTPWSVPRPVLIDSGKAGALGYEPATTYAAAIGAVCRDLIERSRERPWKEAFPGLAAYRDPWFDYAAEDAYLSQ